MAPFGSGKVVQDQSFIFCSAISYLLFASSKFGIAAHFNNGLSHEHLESPPTLNISPCNFLDTSQNLCSAWTLPFPSYPVDSFRHPLVVMPSRGPSKQNGLAQTPKTPMASGKGFQRQCEGGGCSGCDQLMHNSQIGWHQGKVSSISNLLVSTSLVSMFLWSVISIWWVGASCKNNLGMHIRPLYHSENYGFAASAVAEL